MILGFQESNRFVVIFIVLVAYAAASPLQELPSLTCLRVQGSDTQTASDATQPLEPVATMRSPVVTPYS